MAQMTESLARAILNGAGVTRNEIEQLAHAWLKNAESSKQAPSTAAQGWRRVTAPGQVKPGDKLRFDLCGEAKEHTVCMVLHPGADTEEIIYHKRNNWYVITSMVIVGNCSQKNVEFLAHKGAQGEKA